MAVTLPELPRTVKQKEAKFGLTFLKWITENPRHTAGFELKQTTTNSISFSCVSDEQLAYLRAIKSDKGVLIRVQGVNGEPDYVYLRNEPAYIVIKYPKFFCLIDPDTFLLEKSRSSRKSLTSSRAVDIATVVI